MHNLSPVTSIQKDSTLKQILNILMETEKKKQIKSIWFSNYWTQFTISGIIIFIHI